MSKPRKQKSAPEVRAPRRTPPPDPCAVLPAAQSPLEPAALEPRERIVQTASGRFFAHGFSTVTMDDLAAEMGMSKKTLYHYYPAKEDLLTAVLNRKAKISGGHLSALTHNPDLDFRSKLREVVRTLTGKLAEIQPVFLHNLRRYAPAHFAALQQIRRENFTAIFGGLLRQGMERGQVRPEIDVPFVVEMVLSAFDKMMAGETLQTRQLTPAETISKTLDVLFNGVLTRQQSMNTPSLRSVFGLALLVGACHPRPTDLFQGYIEGEYVYVGSPLAGTLESRKLNRGDQVSKGDTLFVLEQESEKAAAREAEGRWAQAKARLENLTKGKRPTELAAIEARLDEARTSLKFWEEELSRKQKLFAQTTISAQELDQTRTQRDTTQASLQALQAELQTARLGARVDEIRAAEADVETQNAALAKARWALDQKTQKSIVTGIVHDTLYRPGEWVAAGNPVVSLLPPENIKVRFFVPETQLAQMKPGRKVTVAIDGAPQAIEASISYVSTQAEFTPPVIYSRETRAKLVYMVEAVFAPDVAKNLRPGQPVDVRLVP